MVILRRLVFILVPLYPAKRRDSMRCIRSLPFFMAQAIILLTVLNEGLEEKPVLKPHCPLKFTDDLTGNDLMAPRSYIED
jgi:hypothetical protein